MEGRNSVLVVDDELGSRESMRMILKKQYDVSTADSGAKAIELLNEKEFDVVILDIRMPGMSGIEVLKRVKEIRPSSGVLMVTAYAALETAQNAMRLGAYDYIEKPFRNSAELRDAVKKGVQRKLAEAKKVHLAEDFEKIRKELFQLEKLSSIGQMTSEVFHELVTPISGVIGYSGLLLDQGCDEIIKSSLEKINAEAERCQGIIRNLLTFARKPETDKELIDINDIIRKAIDLKMYQLRLNSIEVILELEPDLPGIMGNFNKVQQVVINIINNAHQAMRTYEGKQQLTITTQSDSEEIQVRIVDTGPGIPHDKLEIIFEPFFTTKIEGEGTGLGLSISRDIMCEHDGEIHVYSEEGKGAAFTLEFPLTVHQAAVS